MSPVTVTVPDDGCRRPAISASKVDLPAPFTPITPVRPGKTELAQDNGGPAGMSGRGKTRRHAGAPERGHGRAPPRRGTRVNLRAPSDSPSAGDETTSSCPPEPGRCNRNSAAPGPATPGAAVQPASRAPADPAPGSRDRAPGSRDRP